MIISIIISLEYFTGNPSLGSVINELSTWAAILVAFSLMVAFLAMVYRKIRTTISLKSGEWYYSAAFLGIMAIQLYLGLINGPTSALYKNIYSNVAIQAYNAMSATTALFVISAGFKAFRMRTTESTVLMIIAILMMIGQTTLGAAIWPMFPVIRDWVWNFPAGGAMRGVTIVTAIGLVSITLRIVSGITNILGETSEEES